ncbi:winged helix-turn-helix transcriptional regulator [Nocardioides sp. C4-1]|uniref:helix-turn-helix domain-containing protein n=1 Tax=Nocardioides sp. C4-1 TaxID=3151851 RepID=UPI003267CA0C
MTLTVVIEAAPGWDQTDLTILGLLAEGHTVDTVARKVGMSGRTVRRRLRVLADDVGVETTIETVVHAVRVGLI